MSVRKILAASLVCSCLGLAHANADTIWIESPDAGELTTTAQDTTSGGKLTAIQGTLEDPNSAEHYLDIDLFRIFIGDVTAFSAATVFASTNVADPQLFLFDALGNAVFMNDDDGFNGSQSALGALPTGFSSGLYFLGISWFGNVAVDSFGTSLFVDVPLGEIAGAALGAGALAGWNLGVFNIADQVIDYEIVLTGVPEPLTLTLLGAGLAAVAIRRRGARA